MISENGNTARSSKQQTVLDRFQPRLRDEERLRRLLDILRCPETKQPLKLDIDTNELVSSPSSRRWSCADFIPRLFDGLKPTRFPIEHLSNDLAPKARDLVTSMTGLVLNLSAGGSREWFPNVVEVEAGIFRNTDVLADAHNLPFKDESFSLCIAMNAFEHYHTPETAAAEIFRVLKPGATVFIHTAFIQPLHEAPYHFFNATPFGVSRWFREFSDISMATPVNFNPVFALSWIVSELEMGLRAEAKSESADLLRELRLSDLMTFWREPSSRSGAVWDAFMNASEKLQGRLAAGVEMTARKPPE